MSVALLGFQSGPEIMLVVVLMIMFQITNDTYVLQLCQTKCVLTLDISVQGKTQQYQMNLWFVATVKAV